MNRFASMTLRARIIFAAVAVVVGAFMWAWLASTILVLGTGLIRVYPRPSPLQWFEYFPYRDQNPRLHWWLITSAVLGLVAILPALGRLAWELFVRPGILAQRSLYGDTTWASGEQMEKAGLVRRLRLWRN
jgi:hypothetical protein